ncbi:hypothetical protein LY78DRAFT_472401 [Colletotrichum sublineola]|nr:hypothetical protein LY78DRAFT_472401 [Colletotrichum sublineola]
MGVCFPLSMRKPRQTSLTRVKHSRRPSLGAPPRLLISKHSILLLVARLRGSVLHAWENTCTMIACSNKQPTRPPNYLN